MNRAPAGFGSAGRALWQRVTGQYELDPREASLLAHACRQADDVATLEALLTDQGLVVAGHAGQPRLSQVVAELRQSRLAVGKLLGQLDLPDTGTDRSVQSRRAAKRRWAAR